MEKPKQTLCPTQCVYQNTLQISYLNFSKKKKLYIYTNTVSIICEYTHIERKKYTSFVWKSPSKEISLNKNPLKFLSIDDFLAASLSFKPNIALYLHFIPLLSN